MKKLIALCLSVSLLSACGWQLRGSVELPAALSKLHISAANTDSQLLSQLKSLLQTNGATLVDASDKSAYRLNIQEDRADKRSISVSGSGLASEYELSLEVIYSVADATGKPVISNAKTQVLRSYRYDPTAVLSANEEENIIRSEMRLDAAQQIIRRLRFIAASSAEAVDNQAAE